MRLLTKSLGEAYTHTELVIDKPDLVKVDDAHTLLSLLETVDGNTLLVHVIGLGQELSSRFCHNLELEGGWIRLLTWTNEWLVQRFTNDFDVVRLAEPLFGILSYGLDDHLIKCLKLFHQGDGAFIVRVKRKVERILRFDSRLVGKRAEAKWRSHERKLKVQLLVIWRVNVYSFTTVFVLLHGRKNSGSGFEMLVTLDDSRHIGCLYLMYATKL